MNRKEIQFDTILEKRVRWRFLTKWRIIRAFKINISIAEKSLDIDKKVLEGAKKEMDNQKEALKSVVDSQSRNKHDFINKKEFELEKIMNFIGFVDINSIDISMLSLQIVKDRNKWSRNLYARLAFVLMYELTEDICQLLGNDKSADSSRYYGIRPIVQELNDPELTKELNDTAERWNEFKKAIRAHNCNYHQIRNVSTVHRDHDYLSLHSNITNISWSDAFMGLHRFNDNQLALRSFMQSLVNKYFVDYKKGLDLFM